MNFSQKLGLFLLVAITCTYVYFSFFNNTEINIPEIKKDTVEKFTPAPENLTPKEPENIPNQSKRTKEVKIFISDANGKLRPVNRSCDIDTESSCFAFAIKELISSPTKWEKTKGFTSEIPTTTKILSIRESSESVMIDLSSNFETGGGTESTERRIKQLIKTANANTKLPVYLYINGKQANVIGGEGIMIKQPLNERSLDD